MSANYKKMQERHNSMGKFIGYIKAFGNMTNSSQGENQKTIEGVRRKRYRTRPHALFCILPALALLSLISVASHAQSASFGAAFDNYINSVPDSSLVPGGDSTTVGNQFGAFGITRGDLSDTVENVTLDFTSTPGSPPADSIISRVSIYVDADGDQFYSAGDALFGSLTAATSSSNDTARYSIAGSEFLNNVTETFTILIELRHDTTLSLDTVGLFIAAGNILVRDEPLALVAVPVAQFTYPTFLIRVDTLSITTSQVDSYFIHPDSRADQNPFDLLEGNIQGETRTIGGDNDTLTQFGIAIQGNAASQIDSAYVEFGPASTRIDLAFNGVNAQGDSLWTSGAIAVPFRSTTNNDSFTVVARVADTVTLGETVSAYIPADSVSTLFKFDTTTATDSSGQITFQKPRIGIIALNLFDTVVHPDTRANGGDSYVVFRGLPNYAQNNLTLLAFDTITSFGIELQGDISGDSIQSVEVRFGTNLNNFETLARSDAAYGDGADTYFSSNLSQRFTQADSEITVIIRLGDTSAVINTGDSLVAVIPADSIASEFADTGPAADVSSPDSLIFARSRIDIAFNTLGATLFHPESRARGSDTIVIGDLSVRVDQSPFGSIALANDILRHFYVSFDLAVRASQDIDILYLQNATTGDSVILTDGGNDTFFIGDADLRFATTLTDSRFLLIAHTANTSVSGDSLIPFIFADTVASAFSDTGPAVTRSGDTVILNRPRVGISLYSLPDTIIHADLRVRGSDSVIIARGALNLDTNGLRNVSLVTGDTLQQFAIEFQGTLASAIDSVFITVGNRDAQLIRNGDSFMIQGTNLGFNTGSDSTFSIRANIPATAMTSDSLIAMVPADTVFTLLSDTGPPANVLAPDTLQVSKPRIDITFNTLTDTIFHPDGRARGVDTIVIADLSIRTDSSPIGNITLTRDTLQTFYVSFDLAARASADITILYLQNATTGDSVILTDGGNDTFFTANANLQFATTATDSRFLLIAHTADASVSGDSLIPFIFADTVTSAFSDTGPPATRSGDTVILNRPLIGVAFGNLTDTQVHPNASVRGSDSFIIAVGTFTYDTSGIRASVTHDTLRIFNIALTGVGVNSVQDTSVMIVVNNTETGLLTVIPADGDTYGSTTLALNLRGDGTDSFRILASSIDTATNGDTIRAFIYADTVVTTFADTGPAASVGPSDTLTFTTDTVALVMDFLGDTAVSPFRAQNDATLLLSGTIDAVNGAFDTLTSFGVWVDTRSAGFGIDSVTAVILNLPGRADSISLTRSDSVYSLVGDTNIDSMQAFRVYIIVADTEALVGETVTARIPVDSVTTFFTSGSAGDTHSSRTIRYVYTDTVVIRGGSPNDTLIVNPDTTVPGNTTNPFLAFRGEIQGQTSTPGLGDTLLTFGVTFSGTAVDVNDSVSSVQVMVDSGTYQETYTLTRRSGTSWGIDFRATDPNDTVLVIQDTVSVSVFVTVFDTTGVSNDCVGEDSLTLRTTIEADSVNTFYTAETTAITSETTIAFATPSLVITTERRRADYEATIQAGGALHEVMYFQVNSTVAGDTLTSLIIRLTGGGGDSTVIDTVLLTRDVDTPQKYDIGADTIVGDFSYVTGDTWRANFYTAQNAPASDSARYLIVVRLFDSAPVDSSIGAVIPSCLSTSTFNSAGPTTALVYDTYRVIALDTTPPIAPQTVTLTQDASGITITFDPSPSGDTEMQNGQYNVYWDSAEQEFPDTLLGAINHVTNKLEYDTRIPANMLTVDSSYRFRITAMDQAGNESAEALIVSIVFRGANNRPKASVKLTIEPGQVFWIGDGVDPTTGRILLTAEFDPNNASGTLDNLAAVQFETRPLDAPDAAWTIAETVAVFADNNNPQTERNRDGATYSIFWNANSLLPGESYALRAIAIATDGERDTFAQSINIRTTRILDDASYAVQTDTGAGVDSAQVRQVVSTRTEDVTMDVKTPSTDFQVRVVLTQGSLSRDTDKVHFTARLGATDTVLLQTQAAGLRAPVFSAVIEIESGAPRGTTVDSARLATNGALVTITFFDEDNDGRHDSTGISFDKYRMYTINPNNGALEQLVEVSRDQANRTITARTTHFSPFFLSTDTGVTGAGLNQLIVGPNPYRPNDPAFAQNGIPSGIYFRNVPPNTKIEIYTLLGERVTEFSRTNSTLGTIRWDARNDKGSPVASGYYLYVISDLSSGQRVTGKVAVIR